MPGQKKRDEMNTSQQSQESAAKETKNSMASYLAGAFSKGGKSKKDGDSSEGKNISAKNTFEPVKEEDDELQDLEHDDLE